jgi:glycosyltransferase involved in cell wall biosynthesis
MPAPTSVLHIIARMNVGGPAALIVQLVEGLPEQALLTGQVEAGEADYLELRSPSTPFVRVPGLGRSPWLTGDAQAIRFLVRELRDRRPDIVHTHTAKAGVLGRAAALAAGVPHRVHTFHGHLLHGYFSPSVTRAVVLTERTLARRTDRLIAVGEQVRDDLIAAGVGRARQYSVIPPGVGVRPHPDRAAARAALAVPDGPIVAMVGRLTEIKRPDRMLDVAARLPHVTFLVAGDGPALDRVRQGAPGNVRFLGWCSDVEVVHAAANVALLTSDNEGMPVSLIEAALCGTPAVSTDVGSAREVVTGEVTSTDPDDIAAAVLRVLAQPELGEEARRHAEERFSIYAMLRAHATLYEEIAGK